MNAPGRMPVIPVEATQELQAADVLEVLETRPPAKMGAAARRPLGSVSSIAPVGLDLAVGADAGDEEDDRAASGHVLARPRKRFKGLVVGVVSGCALILVAAGVARVVHASDEASTGSAHASAQAAPTPTQQPAAPPAVSPPPAPASPTAAPLAAAAAAAAIPDTASTGTVRLERPAKAGRVWIDGKRITSSSAVVSCGTHRIKVGHARTHSIEVPCGGETRVSR